MANDAGIDHTSEALDAWFQSVLGLCDASMFAVSEQSAHRKAAALGVLTRNARFLRAHEPDHGGALYEASSFVLAAGCRLLGVKLGAARWRAALLNVLTLRVQIAAATQAQPQVGLSAGTAASVFKDHLDEAMVQAGVTDRPTILDYKNRQIALGLCLNWAMRFLLAYALECDGLQPVDARVQDLRWIRQQVMRLASTTT